MEQFVLPLITGISILANLGSIFYFSRKGGPQVANDVIAIFEKRDTEQKELIRDYQSKFEVIQKDLGILQGSLAEKDKKIEEYMRIFQGKSPDQIKYQEDMRDFTVGVANYMSKSSDSMSSNSAVLEEMRRSLADLNAYNHLIMQVLKVEPDSAVLTPKVS